MNRMSVCALALSLGLNLAFSGIWIFQRFHHGKESGTGQRCSLENSRSFHWEIGITKKQWKEISHLVEDFRQTSRIQGQKIQDLRCRLLDLLVAPNTDMEAIENTQKQLYALTLDMKKKAVDLLLGEKAFLSPDQYAGLIKAVRTRSSCDRKGDHNGGSFMRILSSDPSVTGNPP